MGLRHICVTNAAFCVKGIITRKELTVDYVRNIYRSLELDEDGLERGQRGCAC